MIEYVRFKLLTEFSLMNTVKLSGNIDVSNDQINT